MSVVPTDYFPNISSDGTNVEFDLDDLGALTAAEVDIATDGGDGVELAFAVVDQFTSQYLTRSGNGDTLPTGYTATKNAPTGTAALAVTQNYTHTVQQTINYDTTDQPA